jgi:hypothetical protein
MSEPVCVQRCPSTIQSRRRRCPRPSQPCPGPVSRSIDVIDLGPSLLVFFQRTCRYVPWDGWAVKAPRHGDAQLNDGFFLFSSLLAQASWKGREETIRFCVAVADERVLAKQRLIHGTEAALDDERSMRDELYSDEAHVCLIPPRAQTSL